MALPNFVNDLELERYDVPTPIWIREGGLVDAGSLVCFTSQVDRQQKEDVLHSTLFAQLAANKKYNRFTDSSSWYTFYNKVMAEIGWVTQRSNPFEEHVPDQEEFKISNAVIDIFSEVLKDDEHSVKALKDAIESLAKSKEALTLFHSNSISTKHGNFQMLTCTTDKDKQVSVAFVGCYFQFTEIASDYFFAETKTRDIQLLTSTQVLILNKDVYDQVRVEIDKKLGDKLKKFLSSVHN